MHHRALISAVASLVVAVSAAAQDGGTTFRQALDLYGNGMYSQARSLFEALSAGEDGALAEGCSVLCAIKMKAEGYRSLAEDYLNANPASALCTPIVYAKALQEFEEEDYGAASYDFAKLSVSELREDDLPEFTFKKAYSLFGTGDYQYAARGLESMDRMPVTDYSAPAEYTLGYIYYTWQDFAPAFDRFASASKDGRFTDQAQYYMLECRFMQRDYGYVTEHAEEMYSKVPEDRKAHLARIISESYLVSGDASTARMYYDMNEVEEGEMTRKDWFYAGSLLYANGDFRGAVENYSKVGDRTDSLGQVASHNMGNAYMQLRNKVSALDAYREAAMLDYDADIQEDAYFNYAKLAFDLNHDPKPFEAYMDKYRSIEKNDLIYSYMALAALYDHDYAGAVEAYDKIDDLDDNMTSNYMKANYLRAHQLVADGSWRDAVPCLRAAAHYSERHSTFNQLSRYWLAESLYRDGKFSEAGDIFTDLYNNSALDGKPESELIPLGIAYCGFESGDYGTAVKWFGNYLSGSSDTYRKEATTRLADCDFMQADYPSAAEGYGKVLSEFPCDADDIYPYYQQGLAYGLAGSRKQKITALSRVREASVTAPLYSEAMYELGRAYVEDKDYAAAKEVFTTLHTTSRDSTYIVGSLIELGMVSRNQSDYDEALGYYKEAVAAAPGTEYSRNALLAIESICQSMGRTDEYLAYVETLDSSVALQKSAEEKEALYFSSAEQLFLGENYSGALAAFLNYQKNYPQGEKIADSDFYIAECYRLLGQKEQACDHYRKVLDAERDSNSEFAARHYAELSYGLQHWADAYNGYKYLRDNASMADNKALGQAGMMRSAYQGKDYTNAIACAESVRSAKSSSSDLKREADYVKAKSLLATSDRTQAFKLLEGLSAQPKTDEGAEASYLIIQDLYDKGEFSKVEDKVYKFAAAAPDQSYWLAKSYITLGDAFAEMDNLAQAKATFESVRDGYQGGEGDDIADNVDMRLQRLQKLMEE